MSLVRQVALISHLFKKILNCNKGLVFIRFVLKSHNLLAVPHSPVHDVTD